MESKITFEDLFPACLLTRIGLPYFRRDSAGGIIVFALKTFCLNFCRLAFLEGKSCVCKVYCRHGNKFVVVMATVLAQLHFVCQRCLELIQVFFKNKNTQFYAFKKLFGECFFSSFKYAFGTKYF